MQLLATERSLKTTSFTPKEEQKQKPCHTNHLAMKVSRRGKGCMRGGGEEKTWSKMQQKATHVPFQNPQLFDCM